MAYAFHLTTSLDFKTLYAPGFLEAPPTLVLPSVALQTLGRVLVLNAAYFDSGFTILGFVLDNLTAIKVEEIFYEKIPKSLSLSSTTGSVIQDSSQEVLSPDDGSKLVSAPLRNYDPAAGLYATPEGLAKFVRSILHHDLLSSRRTDLYLKSTSFLSTPQDTVDLTPSPWSVDVYTKAGDGVLYAAYITMIPQYDVGITIDVAVPDDHETGRDLLNYMVQEGMPYFENRSRAGTQQATISGGNGPNIDIRIHPFGENERGRVVFKSINNQRSITGIYKDNCANWLSVAQSRCQGLPVDELDSITEDGVVKGLKYQLAFLLSRISTFARQLLFDRTPTAFDIRTLYLSIIYDFKQYASSISSPAQTSPSPSLTSFSYQPQATPSKKMCWFDVAQSRMVCGHYGPDELLRMRWCNETRPCGNYRLNYFGLSRKRDPCIDCILDRRWVLVGGRWRKFYFAM
ncbi:hypothetical protein CEP54_000949 [Fusarium duplospermum]|uniref:Beta-lactamase-related domain-containing protein n=1 Tax=Fusarium duplospermum TaxID=1325734 RepID=A0A428R466_9HYPO|nr:hypothetical protein CEP54_000949 [Fusarium duplospermum]